MAKFYRVIKENFMWDVGAIISTEGICGDGYRPINTIWMKYTNPTTEYISSPIIENCPEYFEQVYPVNLITKTLYKCKEEAKELLAKSFN